MGGGPKRYTDTSKEVAFTEKESDDIEGGTAENSAVLPFSASFEDAEDWDPRDLSPREQGEEMM